MKVQTLDLEVEYPETDGRPLGETDLHREWMIRMIDLLKYRYRGQRVYVSGNLLMYYEEGDPSHFVVPDPMVRLRSGAPAHHARTSRGARRHRRKRPHPRRGPGWMDHRTGNHGQRRQFVRPMPAVSPTTSHGRTTQRLRDPSSTPASESVHHGLHVQPLAVPDRVPAALMQIAGLPLNLAGGGRPVGSGAMLKNGSRRAAPQPPAPARRIPVRGALSVAR
jgi:hypothetical protein